MLPPTFFQCSSGDLVAATGPCVTVRPGFARTHREITCGRELRATLRAGAYAWPGGYPLYFVTANGDALSFASVRDQYWHEIRRIRDGDRDRVIACEVNYENGDLFCEHTGEPIEAAYLEEPDTYHARDVLGDEEQRARGL